MTAGGMSDSDARKAFLERCGKEDAYLLKHMEDDDLLEAESLGLTPQEWYLLSIARELKKRGVKHRDPSTLGLKSLA